MTPQHPTDPEGGLIASHFSRSQRGRCVNDYMNKTEHVIKRYTKWKDYRLQWNGCPRTRGWFRTFVKTSFGRSGSPSRKVLHVDSERWTKIVQHSQSFENHKTLDHALTVNIMVNSTTNNKMSNEAVRTSSEESWTIGAVRWQANWAGLAQASRVVLARSSTTLGPYAFWSIRRFTLPISLHTRFPSTSFCPARLTHI